MHSLRPALLLLLTACTQARTEPVREDAPASAAPAPASAPLPDPIPETSSAEPAPPVASAEPSASVAPAGSAPPVASASSPEVAPRRVTAGCYEQAPQPFLMRGTYWPVKEHREEHRRSVAYRAERYGDIKKLTPKGLHGQGVEKHIVSTTLFGQPVDVHSKIVPALRCVEREITRTCGGRYHPEALSGYRTKNTYHQGEITNHLFGIAVDVDPHKNPCCHCIEPWSNDPRCKKREQTPYEHMSMPRCWVEVFERFGFYWLGNDRLEDTMHFEFLGDPDAIVPPPPSRSKPRPAASGH